MSDRRTSQIAELELDEKTVVKRRPEVEHERSVAIYDLLEENFFALKEGPGGPYDLRLGLSENRLVFDLKTHADHGDAAQITLPLKPFQSIVKDYFMVCESYYSAIKTSSPTQIEAIDMGRRGLHNEGSELLRERLADRVELDLETARRLFTLICVLHIRG